MNRGQIIYEVNLSPDPSIEAEFDEWLEHHVEEMLELPGFIGATIHRAEESADAVPLRSVQYRLQSRAALADYLKEHAARMRADGVQRFGDRFTATRRILDAGRHLTAPFEARASCANCGTALHGQYCASCGQRARGRMISLWELLKEASDVLTSLDSRLWRTLATLLFKPGRLTQDYLLGRRARYIPALRLFIGLSLLFFFLFSLDTHFEIGGPELADQGDVQLNLKLGDDGDGQPVRSPSSPASEPAAEQPTAKTQPGTEEQTPTESASGPGAESERHSCEDIQVTWPENLAWMNRWLSKERLQSACEKIAADHGASFVRALLENIPGMMFLFLPLMAAVMKILYPLTRRFYVEHLLFLVHYHSFFYLIMSMNIALGWLFDRSSLPDWPANVVHVVTVVYLPVYLFRAMRVVYGQGRLLTGLKYLTLGIAYVTSLVLFFAGTVAFTAISL